MKPDPVPENLNKRDRKIRRRWNREVCDILYDLTHKNTSEVDTRFRLEGLLEYVTDEYTRCLDRQRILWALVVTTALIVGYLASLLAMARPPTP